MYEYKNQKEESIRKTIRFTQDEIDFLEQDSELDQDLRYSFRLPKVTKFSERIHNLITTYREQKELIDTMQKEKNLGSDYYDSACPRCKEIFDEIVEKFEKDL